MCSQAHFLDCLDGIQISSLVTLREHTEVITKTLIHLSMWSLFHGKSLRQYYIASSEQIDLEKNNISASQEYSDKVEKRMNRLLITRREFKSNEEKSSWKSYVSI